MSTRKSDTEKRKRGTARPVRMKSVRKSEYKGYPDPGVKLSLEQGKIYKRICDHLKSAGILLDTDCYVIGSMAVSIDARNTAIKLMSQTGMIQEYSNGARNLSPEFSIFQKANTEIRQLSKQLGLDPRSRQDITAFLNQEEEEVDPIAEAMKAAQLRRVK